MTSGPIPSPGRTRIRVTIELRRVARYEDIFVGLIGAKC